MVARPSVAVAWIVPRGAAEGRLSAGTMAGLVDGYAFLRVRDEDAVFSAIQVYRKE